MISATMRLRIRTRPFMPPLAGPTYYGLHSTHNSMDESPAWVPCLHCYAHSKPPMYHQPLSHPQGVLAGSRPTQYARCHAQRARLRLSRVATVTYCPPAIAPRRAAVESLAATGMTLPLRGSRQQHPSWTICV